MTTTCIDSRAGGRTTVAHSSLAGELATPVEEARIARLKNKEGS